MSKESLCKSCKYYMHRKWEWPPGSNGITRTEGGGQVRCDVWKDVEREWVMTHCNQYRSKRV